jgi:aminoglycoside phosphotransferase family enzyme
MIYELWTHLRRSRRYRRISQQITGIITEQSQLRVDKTLTEAYMKATSQQSPPELKQHLDLNMQALIDKANEVMSKENAFRIKQWTTAILEEEERFESGR